MAFCAFVAVVALIGGLSAEEAMGGFAVAFGLSSFVFWIVIAVALNALRDIGINSWWQADLVDSIHKAVEGRRPDQ